MELDDELCGESDPVTWSDPFTGPECSSEQMANDFTYTYCTMGERDSKMPADIEQRVCEGELSADECFQGFTMCSTGTGEDMDVPFKMKFQCQKPECVSICATQLMELATQR